MPDITDSNPDDWISTDHDRVFYRSETDQWDRGECVLANFLIDHIPVWTVVITMGPYRGHDFSYHLYPDDQVIHLDCYSAGMAIWGPDVPHRENHPIVEHAKSLLEDIVEDIRSLNEHSSS